MAFWDNRVIVHRAVPGGYNTEEREGKRTAVFGERPFFDASNSVTLSQYAGKGMNGINGLANGHSDDKVVSNGHVNGKD